MVLFSISFNETGLLILTSRFFKTENSLSLRLIVLFRGARCFCKVSFIIYLNDSAVETSGVLASQCFHTFPCFACPTKKSVKLKKVRFWWAGTPYSLRLRSLALHTECSLAHILLAPFKSLSLILNKTFISKIGN